MSARKRDLIERVKYPNPIPLPPFPPKLVQLNNPSTNYAHPDFSARLANAHPIPTVVDAQAGMDLNLLDFEGVWNNNGRRPGFADESVAPISSPTLDPTDLDPEDVYLLSDLSSALPPSATSNSVPNSTVPSGNQIASQAAINGAKDITWLRRTEYLSAEQAKSKVEAIRKRPTMNIDLSKEAHISRIQSTFEKCSIPLNNLKHPTKPNLKALDSYQVLPDRDTWSTQYQILKFVDWPGKISKNDQNDGGGIKALKDERIDLALFRPVMENGEQRISLYLPSSHANSDGNENLNGEIEESRDEKERRMEIEVSRRFNKRRRTGKFPIAKSFEEINQLTQGLEDEEEISKIEEDESQRHSTSFKFSRDYEPMDQGREVRSQLVFVLDDGLPDEEIVQKDQTVSDPILSSDETSKSEDSKGKEKEINDDDEKDGINNNKRRKTDPPQALGENQFRKIHGIQGKKSNRKIAYFHPISMKFGLRIKRLRKQEINAGSTSSPDFWDRISLSHRTLTSREFEKRAHEKREVDEIDLDFIESDEDEGNDVDGEGEDDNDQDDLDKEINQYNKESKEKLVKPKTNENLIENELNVGSKKVELGDQVSKADVEAQQQNGNEGDGEEEQKNEEEEDDDDDDGDEDDDDDDEEMQEGESVDGDEELAALAKEAGDAGDDVGNEGGRGKRSRSFRNAANTLVGNGDGNGEENERTNGQNSNGAGEGEEDDDRMQVDQ